MAGTAYVDLTFGLAPRSLLIANGNRISISQKSSKESSVEMQHLTARVRERNEIAVDVLQLELEAADGELPHWTPGSHVDVLLPDGDARQYSLAGHSAQSGRWRLGVLVEQDGRGGSRWISENATTGGTLTLSVPRNHFPFAPKSRRIVFVAGGIGITALLPMIADAELRGLAWELHYIGRSLGHMGFLDELAAYGDRVHLYPRDQTSRPDLAGIICTGDAVDVYCCGPEALMEAVEELAHTSEQVEAHVERFSPRPIEGSYQGFDEFEVFFDYSGIAAKVKAGTSILQVAEESGIEVPTSCREGTCGTCETPVMSGEVVHLDSVLSEDEREASATMMICISRANCPRLVLDL